MPELIIYASADSRRGHGAFDIIEWEPRGGEPSPTVLELLRMSGIMISAPCGGNGRCGRCAVWLSGDAEPPDENELAALSNNGLFAGSLSEQRPDDTFRLRLACAAKLYGRCELCFTDRDTPFGEYDGSGAYLSGELRRADGAEHNPVVNNEGFPRLSTTYPRSAEHNPVENNPGFPHLSTGYPQSAGHNPVENNPGYPHLPTYYKQSVCDNRDHSILRQPNETENSSDRYYPAFDLGTTTVSLRVCSDSGIIYEKTELNAQRAFGSDVISRIAYGSGPEGLEELRRAAACQLINMLDEAGVRLGVPYGALCEGDIPAAGNTAMQYLLCGIPPAELGRWPYIPSERFGRTLTVTNGDRSFAAYLPRCSGGFTGGDLTCCLTAVEAARLSPSFIRADTIRHLLSVLPEGIEKYRRLMLCDLGTNGEIALFSGGEILVTSAAAGPALEGGNISCGSGAVTGAVSRIYRLPGGGGTRFGYDVIGGGEAKSLSGCALLELAALLLDDDVIDSSGRMPCETYGVCVNISVTQADIRQLQLAKGAVRAAAERLLELAGISSPDAIIITGGLGYRADSFAVTRTGLLPGCDEIFFTPALAMEGAMLCRDTYCRELSEKTAARCRVAELSGDDRFDGLFVEHMEFPERL